MFRPATIGIIMKWLIKNSSGTVNFDEYFSYIESIKGELTPRVYKFASDWNLYSLDSRSSLHDCWLESLVVKERGTGERGECRNCSIALSLLGAYHDRVIMIEYLGVESYSVNSSNLTECSRGHADLLMHEIRLNKQSLIEHEVVFANGGSFKVAFSDLSHIETER